MSKVKTRCWRVQAWRPGKTAPDDLLVTYPEDNSGHSLLTCLSCGALYAVTVAKEVYVGPDLETQASRTSCWQCGRSLARNWAHYPETYIADGGQHTYRREREIPPDTESIVEEFEGLYEQ